MISLKKISKSYRNKLILNNIDLDIKAGEFVAIIGNSGVGKSTLLNIIGLLENFDSGSYLLNGNKIINAKISKYHNFRAEYFGFVFQMFYLIPHLTVKDNIKIPLIYTNKKVSNNNFVNLLKSLQIDSLINEKVDYLSGGEKQRVAIARALINSPKIVLCDEPTGNLDKTNTEEVMKILRSEADKGKTIILITHDLFLATRADTVYKINNSGELVKYE